MQKCFFDSNPGLDRRFPWKYEIKQYKPDQLCFIFQRLLKKQRWKLRNCGSDRSLQVITELLNNNQHLFSNNGGDIETFISSCMMAHSKRVFGTSRNFKRHLLPDDIYNGFKIYRNNKIIPNTQENLHMYL